MLYITLGLRYVRLVLGAIRAFFREPQYRTKASIREEYGEWRVNLHQPVLAVHPDGRLERMRLATVRAQAWQRILEALAELGVDRGVVLEVGAGDGTNLRALRPLAPHLTWAGCDLIPRSADVCPADATALPFMSNAVAAVVTYHALEQMPREASYQALTEIARVSRMGLVSVEPDYQRGNWAQKLAMRRKDYIRDILAPARAAGFTLVRREWTIAGNPLNRSSVFVFRKATP